MRLTRVRALKPGDSFGLNALVLKESLKTATLEAEEDTCIGIISKELFSKCLSKKERQRLDRYIEFLRQIPFFSGLSRGVLIKIAKSLEPLKYSRGQEIMEVHISQFYKCHEGLKKNAIFGSGGD